ITWYAVGSYNYLIGNYKKAESELLTCQKLNKSFSRVYIGLGMLSRLLSDFTRTTYYFICGTNVSHRPEPWIFAAQNSLKHSDSIKALGFMKKALQIEPNNFLTLIGCASLFIMKSNYYAAKLFLEKSLKIFDSSNGYKYSTYRENAFFNLAMCELHLKNFETAKDILSNHIFSLHNNESYKIAMSICLLKTSDLKLEESLQEIQKYVSQISKYNFLSIFVHMDEIQL
ncbi:MAG: anaphase promoting complex subunit cdc16, partial [Marteilia pararefringens]